MLIAHLGDLHWSSKRLEEKTRCANLILEKLRAERPDAIVCAGDSFDMSIRMEDPAALAAVDFFSKLADIAPVLTILGNRQHDKESIEILPYVSGKYPISLAMNPGGWLLRIDDDGRSPILDGFDILNHPTYFEHINLIAVIVALPYPGASFLAKTSTLSPDAMRKAVSDAIADVVRGFVTLQVPQWVPKILVFHGTILGCMYSPDQRELGIDIDLNPSDIAGAEFDAAFCGHVHFKQEQIVKTPAGKDCWIGYPGGMSITHFNDTLEKGCWFHRFDSVAGNFPPVHTATHFDVHSIPMRAIDVDFSYPFWEAPDWASEVMDLELRVKLAEKDRQRLADTDWKQHFPNALSIDVKTTVEQVASVRCEEVRTAKTLREKVIAWAANSGEAIPAGVLHKAELLETLSEEDLIKEIQ